MDVCISSMLEPQSARRAYNIICERVLSWRLHATVASSLHNRVISAARARRAATPRASAVVRRRVSGLCWALRDGGISSSTSSRDERRAFVRDGGLSVPREPLVRLGARAPRMRRSESAFSRARSWPTRRPGCVFARGGARTSRGESAARARGAMENLATSSAAAKRGGARRRADRPATARWRRHWRAAGAAARGLAHPPTRWHIDGMAGPSHSLSLLVGVALSAQPAGGGHGNLRVFRGSHATLQPRLKARGRIGLAGFGRTERDDTQARARRRLRCRARAGRCRLLPSKDRARDRAEPLRGHPLPGGLAQTTASSTTQVHAEQFRLGHRAVLVVTCEVEFEGLRDR